MAHRNSEFSQSKRWIFPSFFVCLPEGIPIVVIYSCDLWSFNVDKTINPIEIPSKPIEIMTGWWLTYPPEKYIKI